MRVGSNQTCPTWRGRTNLMTRIAIEDEIDRLIDLLDAVDSDADLEPNGDEDDTGMPEGWLSPGCGNGQGHISEDDEDGVDDEPEETDHDGDEQDSNLSEDDNIGGGVFVLGRLEGGVGA